MHFAKPRVWQFILKDAICWLIHQSSRLLTVGTTVDEAAFLFYSLDKACHSQLMAEAAAANGIPKIIISDEVAAYTASSVQNPVSSFPASLQLKRWTVTDRSYSIICTPNSSQNSSLLSRNLMAACLNRDVERRGAEPRWYNDIYRNNSILTICKETLFLKWKIHLSSKKHWWNCHPWVEYNNPNPYSRDRSTPNMA